MELASKMALIFGLFLTTINLGNWIYKGTSNAYKAKKNKENHDATILRHNAEINQNKENINHISDKLTTLFEVMKIQTRHIIVNSCEEAIERGYVGQYELKSLEDMYEMYVKCLSGNSYATTMMNKLRSLEIKNDD